VQREGEFSVTDRPAPDRIHWEFRTGQMTRAAAVTALRMVLDLTQAGAENILDNPLSPSERLERGLKRLS
jgi:hypothetical protein